VKSDSPGWESIHRIPPVNRISNTEDSISPDLPDFEKNHKFPFYRNCGGNFFSVKSKWFVWITALF